MISELNESSLRSICLLVVDCPHATPKWTDSGFIVLRNQNIKGGRLELSSPSYTDQEHYLGRVRRAKPEAGDIVITREAPMGDVCQIPIGLECCLGQRQVLLRPNPDRVDSRFLLYALQSPYIQNQISWNEGTGSTVSNLRIPVLEALKVPLPSLNFQKDVAQTLGAIDDRIDNLRDTNLTLEAIAQALLKSWFIDFDPVRAKKEGRLPEGMNEETAALFPNSFDQSEFGEIPKGWKNELLGNLVIPKRGKTITKAKCIEGYVPVVAGGLEPAYFHNQSNVTHPVITISASGANAGFVRLYQQDVWASDCSFLSKEQTPLVFYWYLFLKFNQEKIYFMQQGAAQPHIYPSDLMRLNVCYPENTEITKIFNDLVTPLFERIRVANEEIHNLANLRDVLLPRLISGQLRLTDAEEHIEAATA